MNKCIMCEKTAVAKGVCLNHWKKLYQHPLYRTWDAMKQRCNNPNNKKYHLYGERGIKICERWQNFNNFLQDMGEKPSSKHSIDRKDSAKGYEPSNCRWATYSEQNYNLRLRSDNTTGHKGIYFDKRRESEKPWWVYVFINKKRVSVGTYKTKNEAIKARKEAMDAIIPVSSRIPKRIK